MNGQHFEMCMSWELLPRLSSTWMMASFVVNTWVWFGVLLSSYKTSHTSAGALLSHVLCIVDLPGSMSVPCAPTCTQEEATSFK